MAQRKYVIEIDPYASGPNAGEYMMLVCANKAAALSAQATP